jgi:hypothetical protein
MNWSSPWPTQYYILESLGQLPQPVSYYDFLVRYSDDQAAYINDIMLFTSMQILLLAVEYSKSVTFFLFLLFDRRTFIFHLNCSWLV